MQVAGSLPGAWEARIFGVPFRRLQGCRPSGRRAPFFEGCRLQARVVGARVGRLPGAKAGPLDLGSWPGPEKFGTWYVPNVPIVPILCFCDCFKSKGVNWYIWYHPVDWYILYQFTPWLLKQAQRHRVGKLVRLVRTRSRTFLANGEREGGLAEKLR